MNLPFCSFSIVRRHFVTLLEICVRFMSAMDSDLLVIGHSFVKRLQVSLLRRGGTTQIVGADLGVSAQFSRVFYHGVGGLKVDGLLAELPLICELGPRAVIVDIGSNDLSHAGVDHSQLASRIVAPVQRVLAVASVSKVVLCQVMPRVAVRPTGRRRYATRAVFKQRSVCR